MKAYPVGAATYSKQPERYGPGAPRYIDRAEGAYVWDEGGNKYIDLTSGMGAVILGHRHPVVDMSMSVQIARGVAFPIPSRLEEMVAERLLSLLKWERAEGVRFGKNGADVTTSAVRLARAVTGRALVVYADYHGHHDWSMTEPPWNAGTVYVDSVRATRTGLPLAEAVDSLRPAAVVLEPAPSNTAEARGEEFWVELREVCDRSGTVMILDEMVSGFRAAPGGGAEYFGIEPDIACYGKAMANGMPLAAVVGPWEYMKRYEEDVFFSLTHGGEAISLVAAMATMDLLADGEILAEIGSMGDALAHQCGPRVKSAYPQRLLFELRDDEKVALRNRGILCAGYANLTLAHYEDVAASNILMDGLRKVLGG